MHKISAVGLAIVAGAASVAQADLVDTYITADNHYALFSSDGLGFAYHGMNETGSGGAPGTYNWSEAEHYTFNSIGGYLYIAAWSDNSSAQGVLADLLINGVDYSSGNAAWQVYRTNDDRGDGDSAPTTAAMAAYVAAADLGNLWESIVTGGINGSQAPWGMVPGINSTTARWMWVDNGQPDVFSPGNGFGEMLIFRIAVPTPGAAALMGLGGLAAMRRRRA